MSHGAQVVGGKGSGYAEHAGLSPVHRHLASQTLADQDLEVTLVVEEPIQVEEALGDDVDAARELVLDDDGSVVFVYPQCVDASGMLGPGGILTRHEADTEHRLQVG